MLLKDFGGYAEPVTPRLRKSLEQRAQELGRKVCYLPGFTDQEEFVAKIRHAEGVGREGLIAVPSTLENCQSFDIDRNAETHQIELRRKPRKCLRHIVNGNKLKMYDQLGRGTLWVAADRNDAQQNSELTI